MSVDEVTVTYGDTLEESKAPDLALLPTVSGCCARAQC